MKTKKYSIWNHYCYMYRELWTYEPKSFLMIFLEIAANVLRPLVAVWLPAYIVGLLEDGCTVGELVFACVAVNIAVAFLNGGHVLLNYRNPKYYMIMRMKRLWAKVLKRTTEMDYAAYEQESMQNEKQKCLSAIYNHSLDNFYKRTTSLLIGVCGLILYSVLIAQLHPLIVVLLLGLSIVQYLVHEVAKRYEKRHRDQQAVHSRYQEYLYNQSTDVKSGKDVRLYQLQKWLIPLYERHNREHQKQMSKNQSVYFGYDLTGILLTLLRDIVCYGYLIYLLTQGMNVSEFVLYIGVIGGYGSWFSRISDDVAKISRSFIGVGDYRNFVDGQDEKVSDNQELKLKEQETFDIAFQDVSFRYPGSDRDVLEHISFHVRAGEKIALVGVNGAGKTTLVKMLCGFYVPTKGRILINGVDVTALDRDKYMEQVSVLFQDSVLFSYTLAQNITGQTDVRIDREKLWTKLTESGLADKVLTLPDREDSYIGKDMDESGVQLSGGQVQKLFLARALYKDCRMLILDEPTAALDALAENEMYDQYARLVENKTSVYISHRLSSTRFCDRIFFLENGRITESGSHEELLEQNGSYAEMFRVQSQYYVEEDAS